MGKTKRTKRASAGYTDKEKLQGQQRWCDSIEVWGFQRTRAQASSQSPASPRWSWAAVAGSSLRPRGPQHSFVETRAGALAESPLPAAGSPHLRNSLRHSNDSARDREGESEVDRGNQTIFYLGYILYPTRRETNSLLTEYYENDLDLMKWGTVPLREMWFKSINQRLYTLDRFI